MAISADDRMLWAKDLEMNVNKILNKTHCSSMETRQLVVPVMADLFARNEKPEYLFWVGCAGAFDNRYTSVARAFAKVLAYLNVSYAVLGKEESCTGGPGQTWQEMKCYFTCRHSATSNYLNNMT